MKLISRKPIAASAPIVLTSFAVLVSERADNRRSIYVEVTRETRQQVERRTAFSIVDKIDPRLEEYLAELARAEHLRRMESTKRLKRSKRAPAGQQISLGL